MEFVNLKSRKKTVSKWTAAFNAQETGLSFLAIMTRISPSGVHWHNASVKSEQQWLYGYIQLAYLMFLIRIYISGPLRFLTVISVRTTIIIQLFIWFS